MNSKERVRAAIRREPVDKVPLGFYVVDYDTIERVIGRKTFVRNKVAIQVALWEGRRDEVAQSLKEDTVDFYRKMPSCDLLTFKEAELLPPTGYEPLRPRRVDAGTWEDKQGRVYRISELTNRIVCVHDPVAKEVEYTLDMFEDASPPAAPDPSVFEACDHLMAQFGAERYIAGRSGGMSAMTLLGGMERGLLMYALHPEIVRAAIAQGVRRQNRLDEYHIRPGQDGVLFEHDMAASKAPLISPAMFREFCFPALRERAQRVKARGLQMLLHNCGNNRSIMDQFIEAGIECYQSLQSIPDMAVDGLKRDFGAHLCFWGGLSLERLIDGTPDEARAAVRHALEQGAPGGGFILGPSHSIAKGTKYGNFMAMLDEFERLRDSF